MLKICFVVTFYLLLCSLVDGVDTDKKVYYKQTVSAIAVKDEPNLKDEIPPRIMEGSVSESPKQKLIKINEEKQIIEKKGKIKPRKGVLETDKVEQTDHDLEKSTTMRANISSTINEVPKQNDFMTSSTTTQKTSTIRAFVPVIEEQDKPINVTVSTIMKTSSSPKPKPQFLVGNGKPDEPVKAATPTNQTPINVPRTIDYIVPVAITVTVLPLLGVAFYVLYKRGRDYWDKRHYRRMDFLIDGMYNE